MRFGIKVLRFFHLAAERERMELRHEISRTQATAMDLTRTTRLYASDMSGFCQPIPIERRQRVRRG